VQRAGSVAAAAQQGGQGYWELIRDPFFDNGHRCGLFWQILASLKRVGIGFSLAAVCGIALGVLIGQSSFAIAALDPIFQVLRTVPPLAGFPSRSRPSRIQPRDLRDFHHRDLPSFSTPPSACARFRRLPQVARVLRLNGWEYFKNHVARLRALYVHRLRIGVGLSWLAIVAAEMLVGGVGIGFFIWDGWNSSLLSGIILALIYVGIIGFLLDRIISFIGRLIAGRPI
jgi:nitrate/nitrite transport system permease protein